MRSNCRLKLFVNGDSAATRRALRNLDRLCVEAIPGEYEVEIIDVQKSPEAAEIERVCMTPTLVKSFPAPERRIVGDLRDVEESLRALDLPTSLQHRREDLSGSEVQSGGRLHALLVSPDPRRAAGLAKKLGEELALEITGDALAARANHRLSVSEAILLDCGGLSLEDMRATITSLRTGEHPIIGLLDEPSDEAVTRAIVAGADDVLPIGLGIECAAAQRIRNAGLRFLSRTPARDLIEANPDGIVVVDADGVVQFANPSAERILAKPGSTIVGTTLKPGEGGFERGAVRMPLGSGRMIEGRAGVVEWAGRACSLVTLREMAGPAQDPQSTVELLASLQSSNAELWDQATRDPLTRLLNRRGLEFVLEDELIRARRHSSPISVLLIDCDDFKGINDGFGHAIGDAVLRGVAQAIVSAVRPTDRIARVGGDEFLVLLPNTRPVEACAAGNRILRSLRRGEFPEAIRDRGVGVSIGVGEVGSEAATVDGLLQAGGSALKAAKSGGKGRVAGLLLCDGDPPANEPGSGPATIGEETGVEARELVTLDGHIPIGFEISFWGLSGVFESDQPQFGGGIGSRRSAGLDFHRLRATLAIETLLDAALMRHLKVLPSTLLGVTGIEYLSAVANRRRECRLGLVVSASDIAGDPGALRAARLDARRLGLGFALDCASFDRGFLEALVILEPDVVRFDTRLLILVAGRDGRMRDLHRLAGSVKTMGAELAAMGPTDPTIEGLLGELGVSQIQGALVTRAAVALPESLRAPRPDGAKLGASRHPDSSGTSEISSCTTF